MPDLPIGTVTFLFTDIEGSTKLLHELGAEAYSGALAQHRRLLRQAFARHGGVEVGTEGDAFFYAFADGVAAVAAAAEAQEALSAGPIRVRMGLHTGTPHLTEEGYVGEDVNKGARIAAAGHGGQVLISRETWELAHVAATDLGEHRVKDFAEPVWIFQLGAERFPPLKTISNTNLPRPVSSFVGREMEVKEVASLLLDRARLLTLTGPGGSGKTRLAIQAAAELLSEYRNGVFWVGLAPLGDPALVTENVAQTLGAKDGLGHHIGEREMLLLLDNFEQVIEAAPELSNLLEACPNLRLLVTSRELLRVRGEVEYRVPPLAEREAVDLFCVRSGLEPDETTAHLCRRLDNLPLAVELAAARTSVLSPAQILDRLSKRLDLLKGGRDAEPRQQTLRATIEWSYGLLSKEEKAHFARFAVFAGGCTLEAAEVVADADLDVLQSLVDKSLLGHTKDRFSMLETIREYASERLEESGEAERVRRRHAEHFLVLAEEAEPYLRHLSREWLDRMEREHDNLRAALDRFDGWGETQLGLRLAGAVSEFWDERGHQTEGRRRLAGALRADDRPTAARAKALVGAASLALSGGDAAMAQLWAEEGLGLHRRFGDPLGTASATLQLGAAVGNQDDYSSAREILEESLRRFHDLGDQHSTLVAARYLAWAYHGLGDLERERLLLEEHLGRSRELGNERMEASMLGALAMIAVEERRLEDAIELLKRSHSIHREHGDLVQTALTLCRIARALALAGKARTAAQVLSSSESIRADMGAKVRWVDKLNEETLTIIRQKLGEPALAEAWEHGRKLTVDEVAALVLGSPD
jgi:predicted ATPase